MLRVNFHPELNSDKTRESCVCRKKLSKYRLQSKNLKDAVETTLRVMVICGIPNYKATKVREVLVKALRDYDLVRYRIDRLPKKRLRHENLIYRLSCDGQFTRKETQFTFAIIRRIFRAFYYGTNECGEHIETKGQLRHTQECFLVHAAKRIAQILALIEGMFYETQNIFEDRIKCLFKDFNDKMQKRIKDANKVVCYCPKCRNPIGMSAPDNIRKNTSKETLSTISSTEEIPTNKVKFCAKVCAEKEAEMEKLETEEDFVENMEEDIEYWFESCNCPKLVCNEDFSIDFRQLVQESSQGPFECKWIPITETETIWDDICTKPENYDICIEPNKNSSETMLELEEFEDNLCYEDENKYGKQFIDDFDEGTRSATISQISCDRCFRCKSYTDMDEFEEDMSTELTEKSSEPDKRILKQKKKKIYDTGYKRNKDKDHLKKGDLVKFDKPGRDGKRIGENVDKEKTDIPNFEKEKTGRDTSNLNQNKDNKNKKGNEGTPQTPKVPGNKTDKPKISDKKTVNDEPHIGGKTESTKVPHTGGRKDSPKKGDEPHTGGKTPGTKKDQSNVDKNKKTVMEDDKENKTENDIENKRLESSQITTGDLQFKEKFPKGKSKKKVNINTSKNQFKRPSLYSNVTTNDEDDTPTKVPDKTKTSKTKDPSTVGQTTKNVEDRTKKGPETEKQITTKDENQTTGDPKIKDPKGNKGKVQQHVDKDKTKVTTDKKRISNEVEDRTTDVPKTDKSNQDLVNKNKTQNIVTKKQVPIGYKNKTTGGTKTGFQQQKLINEFPRKTVSQNRKKTTTNKLFGDNVKKEQPSRPSPTDQPNLKKPPLTPSPTGTVNKTLFPKKILKIKDHKRVCCKCIKKKSRCRRKCPCIEP